MSFAKQLQELRKEKLLTVKELGDRAKVPSTLISGLQSGQRSVGENNATRIGQALGLEGDQLRAFVYAALNEAKRKALSAANEYPSEIVNHLPFMLHSAGIEAAEIEAIEEAANETGTELTIRLPQGRNATLKTELICS